MCHRNSPYVICMALRNKQDLSYLKQLNGSVITCTIQGKSNIKWAMAARNEARLEKVRSDLAKTYPGMKVSTSLILLKAQLTFPGSRGMFW